MALKLAHIVNPVSLGPESDLFVAQPITFESMRIAKSYAADVVDVKLYSAQFPEDQPAVPSDFIATADLDRSILDFGTFKKQRKLPLVRDILDRLYDACSADYLIYTNVDIALLPTFYVTVAALIEKGHDSLIINRRTISKEFSRIEDLPLMFASVGEIHSGKDCFILRREVYPKFHLENICIGTRGMGKALLLNQLCNARNFHEFTDLHVTFHIGDDRTWLSTDQSDYQDFNMGELAKVVDHFRSQNRLPNHPVVDLLAKKGM